MILSLQLNNWSLSHSDYSKIKKPIYLTRYLQIGVSSFTQLDLHQMYISRETEILQTTFLLILLYFSPALYLPPRILFLHNLRLLTP